MNEKNETTCPDCGEEGERIPESSPKESGSERHHHYRCKCGRDWFIDRPQDAGPEPAPTPATGLRHQIGFLVWWRVGVNGYQEINRALRNAGLEAKGFVKRPPCHLALRRACEKVESKLRAEAKAGGDRFQLRPIEVTRSKSHYALAVETVEEGALESRILSELMADKEELQEPTPHEVVDRVLELYQVELDQCPGERVGRALVEIVTKHGNGIAVRHDGGTYFLPPHGRVDRNGGLVKLRAFFEEIEDGELRVVDMFDSRHTINSIGPAVATAILEDVDKLYTTIEGFTGHKKATLKRANQERLLPIRKKIDQYESHLGVDLSHVKARCDQVSRMIDEKAERQVRRRPRLDDQADDSQAGEGGGEDDGLTLAQRRLLAQAKKSIADAIGREDPYLENMADVALAAVAKDCGVEHANALIAELQLRELCGITPLEEAGS